MRILGVTKRCLPLVLGFLLMGFLQPAKDGLALCSGSGSEVQFAGGALLDTQGQPRDAPEGEYKDLQRQLNELLRELEKLEKEAREKFQKEMLPLIKKEIERLRRWLRDLPLKREEGKQEPLRT
jgi:hypothetical protein